MPGCVIILPKTVPPKTVSKWLDLSFGIFARRGEKYSCYLLTDKAKFKGAKILHKENCHKDNQGKPKRNHDKLILKKVKDHE